MKAPKILYFTESYSPTVADQMAVLELSVGVVYRNAAFCGEDNGVEPCDGVAGAVPDNYAHFPSAEDAIKSYRASLKKLHAGLGESVAPGKAATGTVKEDKAPSETGDAPAWKGGK